MTEKNPTHREPVTPAAPGLSPVLPPCGRCAAPESQQEETVCWAADYFLKVSEATLSAELKMCCTANDVLLQSQISGQSC